MRTSASSRERWQPTRRDLLRIGGATSLVVLTGAACNSGSSDSPGGSGGGAGSKGKEAPQLADLVEKGELPPVEERLPKNPLVVEPHEGPGVYGGTWSSLTTNTDYSWCQQRTTGYVGLVRWDPSYSELLPDLAEEWEVNETADVFTFRLREGVKWSDGEPFTAEDIVFFINDCENHPQFNPAAPGNSAEALDDYTVRITLAKPDGLYLDTIASGNSNPTGTPKHYLKQFHKDYNDNVDKLVKEEGAKDWIELLGLKGAMRDADRFNNAELPTLAAWRQTQAIGASGTRAAFERNPYFWKVDPDGSQLPYIDAVEFTVVNDPEVMLTKALNGEVDLNVRRYNVAKNKPVLADNRESGNYSFFSTTFSYMNTTLVALNLTHKDPVKREIFQNKDFRIALSHAINRQEIIDAVHNGQGEPWQAGPRKEAEFFHEELAKQYTEYDVDLANQLLDDAGFAERDGDGFRLGPDGNRISFVIDFSDFRPSWPETIPLVRDYWRELGLQVDVNAIASPLMRERFTANEHDVTVWQGDGGLQDAFVAPQWYVPMHPGGSRYAVPWAQWYETGGEQGEEPPAAVKDQLAVYDELLSTADRAQQVELFGEILEMAKEQFYIIGISSFGPGYGIVNNNFRNVPDHMPESYWYPTPGPTNPEQYYIDEGSG